MQDLRYFAARTGQGEDAAAATIEQFAGEIIAADLATRRLPYVIPRGVANPPILTFEDLLKRRAEPSEDVGGQHEADNTRTEDHY